MLFFTLLPAKMLLALIGFIVLAYFFILAILIIFIDSDINLAFYEKFGKKIDSLRGKVIWVTGASSGIGEGLAKVLARNGARVVLSARREEELYRVRNECIAMGARSEDILVLKMDLLKTQKHEEYFQRVLAHFGTIDILVNNAGRSQRATWENIELDVDREMFELNVFSVISLTRIVVKYFYARKNGIGHVAVMSSLAGIIPIPFSCSYTGSKFAVNGYYGSLFLEKMGTGLDVSVFCPGPVHSNVLKEAFVEEKGHKYNQEHLPTDKRMTAERCGELCAIGLANKVTEGWMCFGSVLFMAYLVKYFPSIAMLVLRIRGQQYFMKLRDNRQTVPVATAGAPSR